MKKKWYAVFSALLLATAIPFVLAGCDSGDSEEDSAPDYLYVTNGTLVAVDKAKCPTNVTIPDGITAINANAFSYCEKLEGVVIPDGVTSIGASAFFGCTSLKSVSIPSSVTNIGDLAFSGYTNLTIYYMGTKAQWENISKGLQAIPSGTTIQCNDGSFESTGSDDSIDNGGTDGQQPSSSDSITDDVLKPTHKLDETSLYRLGETDWGGDFDDIGVLTDFGGTGSYLYYPGALNLNSDTAQLSATIRVSEASSKMGLGFIVVDDDGTVVSYALATTASSVRYFGGTKSPDKENGYAWKDGATLELTTGDDPKPKLLTPKTPYTFKAILSEGKITFTILDSSGNVAATQNEEWSAWLNDSGTVYLALGAISGNTYKIAYSDINVIINDGQCTIDSIKNSDGSEIPSYLIVEGRRVTGYRGNVPANIIIPEGITEIKSYAFSKCLSLISVKIPDSVTDIGGAAFSGCNNLERVTLPDTVTSIGWSAFSECNNLASITIPCNVKNVESYTFSNCTSLVSVEIGKGVTSIENNAFAQCSSLKNVIIPEGMMSIGWGAFQGCNNLTNVTIPDTVTRIEQQAFSDCTNLASVAIHGSVQSIESYTFSNCTSLVNVEIGRGVTSIGDSAFEQCSSLKNVTIPESVTDIGWFAFRGCAALTSVSIPHSIDSIWDAFSECYLLKDIHYNGTKTEWGNIEGPMFFGFADGATIHCTDGTITISATGTGMGDADSGTPSQDGNDNVAVTKKLSTVNATL